MPLDHFLGPCMDGPLARALFDQASGRSRPCIRRLGCNEFTAARPDEVSRRSGPDQWHALGGAPVRIGCPVPLCDRRFAITSHCALPSQSLACPIPARLVSYISGWGGSELPPRAISVQIVRAMRLASATATTFTGLRTSIRSSQSGACPDEPSRHPRRALIWAMAPR